MATFMPAAGDLRWTRNSRVWRQFATLCPSNSGDLQRQKFFRSGSNNCRTEVLLTTLESTRPAYAPKRKKFGVAAALRPLVTRQPSCGRAKSTKVEGVTWAQGWRVGASDPPWWCGAAYFLTLFGPMLPGEVLVMPGPLMP